MADDSLLGFEMGKGFGGDAEVRETEEDGVEGARAEGVVGACVISCVVDGEELDAVEF